MVSLLDGASPRRSVLATVEERFLTRAYASPRAGAWIAAHESLALPFKVRGDVRRSIAPQARALEGGHRFKRKWGLEPVADPLSHLIAMRAGPRVRCAMARQPLLADTGVRLEAFPGPA